MMPLWKTEEEIQREQKTPITEEEYKEEIKRLKGIICDLERQRAEAFQTGRFYEEEYHRLLGELIERVNS